MVQCKKNFLKEGQRFQEWHSTFSQVAKQTDRQGTIEMEKRIHRNNIRIKTISKSSSMMEPKVRFNVDWSLKYKTCFFTGPILLPLFRLKTKIMIIWNLNGSIRQSMVLVAAVAAVAAAIIQRLSLMKRLKLHDWSQWWQWKNFWQRPAKFILMS